MALVEVKCPNCGANLVADNSNGKASCIYCHTEFVLSNETDDNSAGNTAHTDVNLDILDRADTFLNKLENYSQALELYEEYSLMEPGDYRGWWGIACALSQNFTKPLNDIADNGRISECVGYALKVCGDKYEELERVWLDYSSNAVSGDMTLSKDVSVYKNPIRAEALLRRLEEIDSKLGLTNEQLEKAEGKFKPMSNMTRRLCKGFSWCYGVSLTPLLIEKKKKSNIDKLHGEVESLIAERQEIVNELKSFRR